VRRELGLPTGYGTSTGTSPSAADRRFTAVVGAAYPVLTSPFRSAVRIAVDLGRVTAAASNGGHGAQVVTVLATDQPFADVSGALVANGYTLDGDDVLRAPNSAARPTEGTAVAGGRGIIVVGGLPAAVLAAAQGRNGGTKGPARQLAESLDAPAVSVIAPNGSCVKAIGVADDIKDRRGRLVVVADRASADRIAKEPPAPAFHLDPPKIEGDRATANVSYNESTGTSLGLIGGEVTLSQLYRCG